MRHRLHAIDLRVRVIGMLGSGEKVVEIASKFFSDLHRLHLKAKGYRKQRHTFTRDHPDFTERVQFQGSAWNSSGSPWRFYINFGVQFRSLPPRLPDRDLPGTHCWTRIESLVPEAPAEFELASQHDKLSVDLVRFVEMASQRVAQQIDAVRERYEKTRSPRLSLH